MIEPSLLLPVLAVVALATFTHAVTGFGLALVSMPLLVDLIGIRQAAPLVALIGVASQIIVMLRYRQRVVWRDIRALIVGSVIGIPFGVLLLAAVNEALVTLILGVLVIAYALYALLAPGRWLPAMDGRLTPYGIGLAGGVLTGAYNSGGPPLVIYANARRWMPDTFKGNLQAVLISHSATAIAAHGAAGTLTPAVLTLFLTAIPVLVVAIFAGFFLDRFLNPRRFHQLVLVLLVVLGLRLIAGALA
jgi:uncharacterized membrane protein YfcA